MKVVEIDMLLKHWNEEARFKKKKKEKHILRDEFFISREHS